MFEAGAAGECRNAEWAECRVVLQVECRTPAGRMLKRNELFLVN